MQGTLRNITHGTLGRLPYAILILSVLAVCAAITFVLGTNGGLKNRLPEFTLVVSMAFAARILLASARWRDVTGGHGFWAALATTVLLIGLAVFAPYSVSAIAMLVVFGAEVIFPRRT